MKKILCLFVLLLFVLGTRAEDKSAAPAIPPPEQAAAPKTFLIVLRLPARLHDEKAWTDADKTTVGAHFKRLKEATDRGQVILAGRTHESLDQTIGLVVFTAADEAVAREFMTGDPCIAAGVMTATLHPYDLALLRKN